MRFPFRLASAVALVTVLSACATGGPMVELDSQEVRPPAPDKAKVVFMRTSFVSSAIGADLFEVVNGELKYIGQVNMGKKIAYETTPGKKVFMAYGVAADFMLGDLLPGRTYYSIVRPNWGSGGMIPTPVRSDGTTDYNMKSADFAQWMSGTKLVAPAPGAQEWFAKEKGKYQGIYAKYWPLFEQKTPDQKAERTLRPQDGVAK